MRAFSTQDDGEAAAKASAREFMNAVKDEDAKLVPIEELETNEEWKPKVMEATMPVILDCYADWCQPCR